MMRFQILPVHPSSFSGGAVFLRQGKAGDVIVTHEGVSEFVYMGFVEAYREILRYETDINQRYLISWNFVLLRVFCVPDEKAVDAPAVLYRVQAGAFRVKANAQAFLNAWKEAGFDGFITAQVIVE